MLPPHTLIVEDFAEFRELVRAWIEGHYELMVVLGRPGVGKSETVERLMFDAKGKPNQKWAYIKGKITPLTLYQTLYDFRLLPIVFNDVDTLLKEETTVSLLKCVCDTSKVKHVQWTSTHASFGTLPKSFDSISRVLLIANSWERVNQNISALHNRGVVILFRPSAVEVHREIGESGWFDDRDVWEFIGRNLFLMIQPDLRFYLHARNHKLAGRDWKDLTLRMLEVGVDESGQTRDENEKLIFVATLLADPKYDAMLAPEGEREKTFQEAFPHGGSRATYHRHKMKLNGLRGRFDPEAVAKMQWKGAIAGQTPFDLKQEQRRASLERQREELEKAGGVLGVGAADDVED